MTNEEYRSRLENIHNEIKNFHIQPLDDLFECYVKKEIPPKLPSNTSANGVLEQKLSQEKLNCLDDLVINFPPSHTLGQYIRNLVDQRNIKDSEVYLNANLPKEYWHKLVHDKVPSPSINRLIRIGCALKLSDNEMFDLLANAGHGLDILKNIKFIIIAFCFNEKIYSLPDIESLLSKYCDSSIYDSNE